MAQTCCLWTFPISELDPRTMHTLGYTADEVCLWDYSTTEEFYIWSLPPEITSEPVPHAWPGILYSVTPEYAYQWFGLNGDNGLVVVYFPFTDVNWVGLSDPCWCLHSPIVTSVTANHGFAGDVVVVGGQYFTGAMEVDFGTEMAAFTFVSDTQIIATVPSGVVGSTVDVKVTTTVGTSAPNPPYDQFTYDVVSVTNCPCFDPATVVGLVLT